VNVKEIILTRGLVALVDDADYSWLSRHKWHVTGQSQRPYATRKGSGGKRIFMHVEIMQPPVGMQVDHINGNQLDNRRENLRLATHQQNMQNKGKREGTTASQYKGIHRRGRRWYAYIYHNGRRIYLGSDPSEVIAAQLYDAKAIELQGEFACLNFPRRNESAA
jgi:hypothetical protein